MNEYSTRTTDEESIKILYSDIPPVPFDENTQETVVSCFNRLISVSKKVELLVGYVSKASLEEIDFLVEKYDIEHICLNIGMYYVEGMPENIFHEALRLDKKWRESGIGEIRLVTALKYHGKSFMFYAQDGKKYGIIGSSNLSVIKPDASTLRQYEFCVYCGIQKLLNEEEQNIIEVFKRTNISANITQLKDNITLIRQPNVSLKGNDNVRELPISNVEIYRKNKTDVSFILPLKVPSYADRLTDDGRHFTKSNINVCYAAPRNKYKNRDWYEVQLTVAKEITRIEGYPEKNKPFFVVTDDGFMFKAHTTSDGNKQFSAVGDELIMGRWVKGRLAAAGLVVPQNDTGKDVDRQGAITEEILNEYGRDCIRITKTTDKALDKDGNLLDVWLISMEKEQQS